MVAVGKDLVLHRQKGPAGIDEIDAGQIILLGDLLRAKMFFDGKRVIGSSLHRGVIGDDHAFDALHAADSGDDAGRSRRLVIEIEGGELAYLEEGRAGIDERVNTFARRHLAARLVPRLRLYSAAEPRLPERGAQIADKPLHRGAIGQKLFGAQVDRGFEDMHQRVSAMSSRPINMRRISEVPAPIS